MQKMKEDTKFGGNRKMWLALEGARRRARGLYDQNALYYIPKEFIKIYLRSF